MVRAYDDNGNVVDLVEWEKQIRAEAIDEFANYIADQCNCCIEVRRKCNTGNKCLIWEIAEQLKEQK